MLNRINNKRGVSEIIATMMIILVSLSAIAILYAFITNITSQPAAQFSPSDCISLQASPPITIKSACFNQESRELELEINRKFSDIGINHIDFLINYGDKTIRKTCGESCNNCILLKQGQEKKYFISSDDSTDSPESVTISTSECQLDSKKIENCE